MSMSYAGLGAHPIHRSRVATTSTSYARLHPSYWQALQPDGPWEAGAPGWWTAPYVGWGENPDRHLPPILANDGCCGGCGSTGQTEDVFIKPPIWPVFVLLGIGAAGMWAVYRLAQD
jgi:hypothetical protein